MRDAKSMEAAGACAIVLEVVPAELAARVSEILTIPTIGIGAGSGTDAQVMVWQDLVGLTPQVAEVREALRRHPHDYRGRRRPVGR